MGNGRTGPGKGDSVRDDLRLARRIQQGEPHAFEEFVDSYGARIHGLVRRYVVNPSDAEDMTQEIFVHLYRNMGTFRGDSLLSTWVYRVAVNLCLKHCQRARPESLPYEEQTLPATNWQADPAQAAAKRELSEQVHNALEQLSPQHQDVVILHELHGLTYQECAQALEIPIGTVKSRLFNAFRRLQASLSAYVQGEAGALCVDAAGEKTS